MSSAASMYRGRLKVDFYYDTISPYSWFAFELLLRYRASWNLQIDFRPTLMAALAKASNSGFLGSLKANHNKANRMYEDLERLANFYKVPLRVPESPFYLVGVSGSLRQQRLLTAVKQVYPHFLLSLSRQLWLRAWSEDLDLNSDNSLRMVGGRAGLSEDEFDHCLTMMESDECKLALKETTQQAFSEGAPGLPFMVFHKNRDEVEGYFGSDRFELIAHRFGLTYEGPMPSGLDDVDGFQMEPSPHVPSQIFVDDKTFDMLEKERLKAKDDKGLE